MHEEYQSENALLRTTIIFRFLNRNYPIIRQSNLINAWTDVYWCSILINPHKKRVLQVNSQLKNDKKVDFLFELLTCWIFINKFVEKDQLNLVERVQFYRDCERGGWFEKQKSEKMSLERDLRSGSRLRFCNLPRSSLYLAWSRVTQKAYFVYILCSFNSTPFAAL